MAAESGFFNIKLSRATYRENLFKDFSVKLN